MEFSAAQIAKLLNGDVAGNPDAKVSGLSKIEEGMPGTLSFLANPKYNPYLYTTDATIVIVNKSLQLEKPVKETCTLIRVDDAYTSFATLLEFYNSQKKSKKGIEQPSYIHSSAKVGSDVYVGAFAYIGENVSIGNNVKIYPHVYVGDGAMIGDNTTLFSGVRIYHECVVGNNCTIHANTVIGADGFGFAPGSENYTKVPQIGNVIIEDHVEIGACTCIDRATMGSTIIRKGAKLDNLIQVAHNAEVGENTVIAGQTGVAGSSKVGKNCMIGAQVGVTGHIKIADGTKIAGQSGIGGTIKEENTVIQGSPAFGISEYRRSYVLFKNLPNLADRVKALENFMKQLDGKQNQ